MQFLPIFLLSLVNLTFSAVVTPVWTCKEGGYDIDLSSGEKRAFQNTTEGQFLSPQNCQWRVKVPSGKYAETVLNLYLNPTDTFFIYGVNYNHGYAQNGGDMPNGGPVKLYVPAGNYTMTLISTRSAPSNGSFFFTIQALALPSYQLVNVDTAITNQQLISVNKMRKYTYVINPTFQYTIRTMMSNCNGPDYRYDRCLLYKGNAAQNGVFVSGLSSLMNGVPPRLDGIHTVLCFDDILPDTGMMLISPFPNVFQFYDTWQVTTGCTSFPFISTGLPSAYVTDYCEGNCTKYVQDVTFTKKQPNYQLTMYTGCIGATTALLDTFSTKDSNYLPQQITGGQWKTFQFQNGEGSLLMDSNAGPWQSASVRSGFFATPNVNTVSAVQNYTTIIKSPKKYDYKYWVSNLWDGTLTVTIDTGNGTVYKDVRSNITIGDLSIKHVNGYGITFDYKSGSVGSRGAEAKFVIAEVDSASATYCKNGSYDVDLSQKYTFPNANQFFAPQNCQWRVSVPPGKYAETVLSLYLNPSDTFFINGVNFNHGYSQVGGDMPNGGPVTLYIPAGNYTMSLISAGYASNNGSFSFSMQALPLPNYKPTTIDTAINNQLLLSLSSMRKGVFLINPNYKFTIRTMIKNCNGPDYRYDRCLVYKGNATGNSVFVTGLSSLINGVPPKFDGIYTVLCFDDTVPETGMMLVTPYPIIQPSDTWQVTTGCTSFPFAATGAQNAYLTDYCGTDCIKYVQNVTLSKKEPSYQFTMYTGCIGTTYTVLDTFNANAVNYLPQQITGGQWKTFQFRNGEGSLNMDSNPAPWQIANVRSGFFASPNVAIVSAVQDATTTIKSSKQYKYSYWLNMLWDGALTVTVYTGNGTSHKDVYSNFTVGMQKIQSINGYGITFDYKMSSMASRGVEAKFTIDEVKASNACSFLLVVSALLVWIL